MEFKNELLPYVDPELREAYLAMDGYPMEDIAALRDKMERDHRAYPPAALKYPNIKVTERTIPGGPGNGALPVTIFEPIERTGILPCLYYIHGGGFIMGATEHVEADIFAYCDKCGCMAVGVDYRLAPEFPFPAGLEDCFAAYLWLIGEGGKELGIDTSRIAMGGGSAGGGLVISTALLIRDRGVTPAPGFLMPLFPALDDRNETLSANEITDLRVWSRDYNLRAWEMYLGGGEPTPYAAPARMEDLSGLPSYFSFIGSLDPFRDENLEFVSRLVKAGVHTEFHLYHGGFHGFNSVAPSAAVSYEANHAVFRALKKALGT